jgi:CelD/BcsL family acetyltransferase involved in cellulose biosynthesis
MTALHVDVVSDLEAFGALRPEWDALLSASDAPSVFLTWEWLHTWWRHLAGGRRLHLVLVRRDGELVALAPLCLASSPLFPGRLEMLGTGVVGSDHLDVIVRGGHAEAALEALAAHVGGLGIALDLCQLRDRSRAAELVARLDGNGWRQSLRATDVCPYLRLADHDWNSFLGTLGAEHRANVRRRIRKLKDRGVSLEEAASEESRRGMLAVLLRLHELRWSTRGGSDAFGSPAVAAFHGEATSLALERGWLRLQTLFLQGQPVAALYGLQYAGRFSFYQSGFDPAHASSSVGLVLLALSIEKAIQEGASEFDLLHGDESYKFLWAHGVRELVRIEADPPGPVAVARRAALAAVRGARAGLRRFLPATWAARLAALRRSWAHSHHAPATR